MKLSEVNIGDYIRITYKSCFEKKGTVITKMSSGIVLQTYNNHHMFFAHEFFNEDVNVDIIKKNSSESICEEIVPVRRRDLKEVVKCGEKIITEGAVYTITGICYGSLEVSNDNFAFPNHGYLSVWDGDLDETFYLLRTARNE